MDSVLRTGVKVHILLNGSRPGFITGASAVPSPEHESLSIIHKELNDGPVDVELHGCH
jgi:hypothetical protein